MHLIVAEKNISARRIAQILAGSKSPDEKKDGGVSTYWFGDTVVVGLRGHVVEIDFVPGYTNWRSEKNTPRSLIDAPTIKVPTEKKIVSLFQKLAKKSDRVTIATDFDTEGELIGKEAYELVREVNPTVKIDRSRFSAITPQEISHAFSHTTDLDFALASAGEARQIIDLMWGASLTRFISIAARRGGQNILSVGRVQSPTLAMIVDREREIEAFIPEKYWQLGLDTEKSGETVEARHTTARFTDKALALAAKDRSREPLVVTDVKKGERIDRAPTPFDTTSYIVAASRLGISAARAMRIAEDLYMNGYISYPRTDNTVYPPSLDLNGILKMLRPTAFGKDVDRVQANRRPVPTAGKKSTTDHPPIHPAGAAKKEVLSDEEWKVYELVVRRFLATLSPDALWTTMKVNFDAGGEPYTATGGQLASPGWRAVYPYSEAKEYVMPPFVTGEKLPIKKVRLEEKETQPPPRYSQSRLIQQMEELGLGTKSTRHEVIQKLLSRKYIEGNPLRPTLVGRAVIQTLEDHAATVTAPEMTQTLEQHMQLIKERKKERDNVITESRAMLHKAFDQLEAHEQEIGDDIRDMTAEELTLGACPSCGGTLRIRHTKGSSQFIGCARYPECSFNIGLPGTQWGLAVRGDEVCPTHHLHHIRLVRKGARPWEIGCPLCQHISSSRETLSLISGMTEDQIKTLHAKHIYSVQDIVKMDPAALAAKLAVPEKEAARLHDDAVRVLDLLRRRSECKKFVRKYLIPRKGRSNAQVMKNLHNAGVDDIEGIVTAGPEKLRSSGISEKEAAILVAEAKAESAEKRM
ncbi:MAG: DNA topoisomerase I, partial [Methanoregulaceae archaeon]